ncbi:MAG: TonB-dependent receptor, partial [Opitutae bacterium]|nr:TonB-dependent receptor [Opitutae bacterium]
HAQSATDAPTSVDPVVKQLPTTIVTGDLWQSELERTTASVTVIDQALLDTNGVQHFEDIVNAVPNLTWTGGSSRPRYIQIRGIGENSQFEGETPDSAVRFLIDDLDLTGLGTVGNLFDVQQVEVLRGPQAGAFGANAAGGVIKIVTNDPTPYWTGQVEGTVGEDSLVAGGLAVGGPILESDPEKLTFRLALHQLNQDGFRHNKYLGKDDTNERDEFTSRFKLRWLANEDWQWDGTLLYADANNGYDEFSLDNTEFDTYSDQPGRDEQETVAGSIRGTWKGLDDVEFVSITSYTNTDSFYGFDGDFSNPSDPLYTYTGALDLDRERDVFSQEFSLNSVDQQDALGWIDRWTVGLYYQQMDESTTTTGFGTFDTEYNSDTYSIFGQATHEFSEKTRITLGLRAEYFDLRTERAGLADANFDDLLIGGKLTLEQDLSSQHSTFASVTRGYKAGGANIYPFIDPSLPTTYDTEHLWNYVIGLNSEWFDGAVTTQITLFYLDRDDTQVRGSSGSGISYSYFTLNGDSAAHYGAEADLTWYINNNWTFSASAGVLETDRERFVVDSAPTVMFRAGEVSNAPAVTHNVRVDYQSASGFFASIEVVGSHEYYESNSHNEKRNAFAVVNSSIGYRYENWTFTLWAKNLFDEGYEKRIFYFANNSPGYNDVKRFEDPADPQQFGITANYRW